MLRGWCLRVGRDDVNKTAAGQHQKFESFGALVHPGDSTRGIERIDFVGRAIGNAGEERLVGDRLCLGAAQVRDVARNDE